MSNIDWTHALELFNKETETLEGGGIIVHHHQRAICA